MQINSSCADINDAFSNIPMLKFPYSETPLIGIDNLQRFLKMNDDQLEKQLDVCWKRQEHKKVISTLLPSFCLKAD